MPPELPEPQYNVCPICMHAFPVSAVEQGMLTVEHAPPEALGGGRVALTCRPCNSTAGGDLDQHMLAWEQVLDFGLGTLSRPMKNGRLGGFGHEVTTQVSTDEDGATVLRCDLEWSNLADHTALFEDLERTVNEGRWREISFRMTTPSFDRRAAYVGWLRSAYIVAFAALGHTYLRTSDLKLVREQIQNPSAHVLHHFSLLDQDAPGELREIRWVLEPGWLDGLVIRMGRHVVFLPQPDAPSGFYDRLAARTTGEGMTRMTVAGKEVVWPRGPRFDLDFLP
jgi:hypothetical protein